MNNQSFWESYKAKCNEKGLNPHHDNAEEFDKAMTEPPRPYSTDDLVPSKEERASADIEGWHRLEEGVDDIDVEDLEDCEQVARDAKNRRKGDDVKNVEWKRCEHCGEMKEDMHFRRYRNGEHGKVCNVCIGSKISAAKSKRIEALKPLIEEKKISLPDSKLLEPSSQHCDAADAIAMSLHVNNNGPLLKEKVPLKAMSEEALRNLLRLAFLAGVESVNVQAPEEVTQEVAMELLNNVITECKGARA